MARVVVAELQRQGYETYEEVSMGRMEHRADIVGVFGCVVVVVECKAKRSLALLDQLMRWQNGAHYIIGAHGFSRRSRSAEHFCRLMGFGLWTVGVGVEQAVAPILNRAASVDWAKRLKPEQRSGGEYAAAGTTGGGYYTPFRNTVKALARIASEQPGIELRVALKAANHHYASMGSAVSSIPELIRKGVIKDLRAEGRPLKLYPTDYALPLVKSLYD